MSTAFNRFAWLTVLATFALVGLGGLVTSHGVGLAVPDWPNTYGYNMFFFPFSMWIGGIFYEHSHRLLASGVGLMTTILAIWLYGRRAQGLVRWGGVTLLGMGVAVIVAAPARWQDAVVLGLVGAVGLGASFIWPRSEPAPRWLRRLGLIAFFGVIVQGVLGGLRVTAIKDELGIFHATLAQLFLCLILAIALFTTRWWKTFTAALVEPAGSQARRLAWGITLTTTLILAQLATGATMRHAHAGLAIPDFPKAHGQWWPDTSPEAVQLYNQQRLEVLSAKPITAAQIVLQMVHRLVAVGILGAVVACAWAAARRLGRSHPLTKTCLVWVGLILIQAGLGAWTIWSNKAADIATLHVLTGAASLATGAIACIVSVRLAPLEPLAFLRSFSRSEVDLPRGATASPQS